MKNTIPSSLNIKYYKLVSRYWEHPSYYKNLSEKHWLHKFLHLDSEHPKSLEDTVPYGQAFTIKQICTTPNDFNQYYEEPKQRWNSQGYKPELINKDIRKIGQEKNFRKRGQYHLKRSKNFASINI